MRASLAGPILLLLPLLAGSGTAHANPVFLHALSDAELAANSAGYTRALQIQAGQQAAMIALPGLEIVVPPSGLFGLQTVVRDTGTSSLSQAMTEIALTATRNAAGF